MRTRQVHDTGGEASLDRRDEFERARDVIERISVDQAVRFDADKEQPPAVVRVFTRHVRMAGILVEERLRDEESVRNPGDAIDAEVRTGDRKIGREIPLVAWNPVARIAVWSRNGHRYRCHSTRNANASSRRHVRTSGPSDATNTVSAIMMNANAVGAVAAVTCNSY